MGASGGDGVAAHETAEQVVEQGTQRRVVPEGARGSEPRTRVVEGRPDSRVVSVAGTARACDDGEEVGDHDEEAGDGEKRQRERKTRRGSGARSRVWDVDGAREEQHAGARPQRVAARATDEQGAGRRNVFDDGAGRRADGV